MTVSNKAIIRIGGVPEYKYKNKNTLQQIVTYGRYSPWLCADDIAMVA
jgi:hypothetical protein